MKKFIALFLSMVMLSSITTSVFAEETNVPLPTENASVSEASSVPTTASEAPSSVDTSLIDESVTSESGLPSVVNEGTSLSTSEPNTGNSVSTPAVNEPASTNSSAGEDSSADVGAESLAPDLGSASSSISAPPSESASVLSTASTSESEAVSSEVDSNIKTPMDGEAKSAVKPYAAATYELTYTLNEGGTTVTVTGINGTASGELVLPASIEGKPVTAINGGAFFGCYGFTGSLMIPDSVTAIGESAFQGCSGFTGSLTIPNGVTTIKSHAFSDCSGFTGNLTIPNSVTTIGGGAFSGCSGFTDSLTIPDGVTTIGNNAFAGCSGFTGSLTLPNSVATIGYAAFSGCSGFTGSLMIPNSVTTIGNSAFGHCTGFTGKLTLPDSVTTIDRCAFYGCSGFTGNLTIPNSVTTIGGQAFVDCSGFTGNLTIPNSVTTIDDAAFSGCSGFTDSLTISNSVTTIGNSAFGHCTGFTGKLTLPDSVTTIGDNAFRGCGFTGNLTLPDSITTVGDGAFYGCSGFTGNLTIPSGVTTIGDESFYGCCGFTGSLTIPNSAVRIGDSAFFNCIGFTGSLTISNSVTTIGDNAFEGCTNFTGSLTIPDGVTTIGGGAFEGCSGFTGSLTLPNSVATIGYAAFSGCSGFTGSLMIPSGVTRIGNSAFYGCAGFTGSLTILNGVTTIGNSAFSGCRGFTGSLTIPNSVTTIWQNAFSGCSGLTGKLMISNSVTTIGEWVFSGCSNITNVTIPRSVLDIRWTAFQGCANLKFIIGKAKSYARAWAEQNKLQFITDDFTGVALTATELSLEIGDSATLAALVLPLSENQTVTWTSDKTDIATVDANGKVTAVNTGTATITATTKNNKTAACIVTVKSELTDFTFTPTAKLQEGKPNVLAGAVAGVFTAPIGGEAPFAYVLTNGDGTNDADNGKFTVNDTNLIIGTTALSQKEYHVLVKITGNDGQTFDKAIIISVAERESIKGTLAITGTAMYGETLTAKATGTQADAKLSYVWKSGTEIVGTDSATYTIVKTDVGKIITVTASDANYKGALTAATAQVAKKAITATATAKDKIYDGNATAEATLTLAGNMSTDKVTATATAAFNSKDAGKDKAVTLTNFKLDTMSAQCYICAAPTGLKASITQKQIDATANTLKITKEYDGTSAFAKQNASGKLAPVGVLSGDTVNVIIQKYGASPSKNTGNQKITLTLAVDNANYTLKNTTYPDFTATITQKPLTATMFQAIAAQTYTGNALKPAVVIADSEKTLLTGDDFTVTYANNTNAGTAAMAKITAKTTGNYSGEITQTFTINKESSAVTGIKLNETAFSLIVGENKTVTATVTPANATDKTVTWTSDKNDVATVDMSGKVTAVKTGTATITATTSNGKSATCAVTVTTKKPDVVDVTGITLNETAFSLIVGESKTVTATVTPANATDKTVTWMSSNPTAVSVENGKVTAVKAGTAAITAKTANGKSATCAVIVTTKNPDVVAATGVTLNKTSLSLTEGNSETLTATVLPANATDKTVTWTSSNAAVASVENGKVTALKVGKTTITATANGKTATCEVLVKAVPEHGVQGFVERLYSVALGRESDAGGKAAWTDYLKQGKVTGADVARDFILSKEMNNRNLSNEEFMSTIYETFFNRAPDAGGMKGWMNFLENGLSREFVVSNFAGSAEFQNICNEFGIKRGSISAPQPRDKNPNLTAFVNRLYTKLLDRQGEEAGLNNWCAAILSKASTPKKIAHDFVFSKEFELKNLNNEKFVEYMYRTFMGREYDAAGKAAWVKYLQQGKTREDVFNGFADSTEFANITKGFGL